MHQDEATRRFHDVLWPHAAAVLSVARLLTNNQADAEDLAQETMLKAFRGIDGFKDGTDARAWLLAILRNARVDRIRSVRGWGKDVSLDALGTDPEDEPEPQQMDWFALRENPADALNEFSDQQLIDALEALPEEIRWTLLLTDVEGMDQVEAAEVLSVPVGTIKSRLHRGRGMLRQALLPLARERRLVRD